MTPANNRLTPKQEAFVESYLRLQNGTKAYLEAYAAGGQMPDNEAAVGAYRLLRNAKIANALAIRKEQIQALSTVSAVEELAERWTEEIRFDIAELMDPVDGGFCTPEKLSPKARRVVQEIDIREDVVQSDGGQQVLRRRIKYKLPDRQRAKIELGKRLGFYPAERVEMSLSMEVQGLLDALPTDARQFVLDELRRRMTATKRAAA